MQSLSSHLDELNNKTVQVGYSGVRGGDDIMTAYAKTLIEQSKPKSTGYDYSPSMDYDSDFDYNFDLGGVFSKGKR